MAAVTKLEAGHIAHLPLAALKPDPAQPRKSIDKDALASLAKSIAAIGVLQPIIVRREKSATIIVSGERRWRAAKLAKLKTIPCMLAGELLEGEVGRAAAQLAENVERQGLNTMEIAEFLADLQKREKKSVNELMAALDKLGVKNVSHARIDKLVQFVELPKWVQRCLREGTLTETHAVHLLPVRDVPAVLEDLDAQVANRLKWSGSITVRDLQNLIEQSYCEIGVDLDAMYPESARRAFPIDVCKGCEHLKKIGGRQYCMNRPEFERKQKEALDLKAVQEAERAERKARRGEDRSNPDPTQVSPRKLKFTRATIGEIAITKGLQYDTYKELAAGGFDVAGCAGCPHKHLASRDGDPNEAEETCFHLPCYAVKQRAGRLDERREEKLEAYLDAWLRPRLLELAPARATARLARGVITWLATAGLHHAEYGIMQQRHEKVAEKTRALLAKHKCRDIRDVVELGAADDRLDEVQRDLIRCAVAVMDPEQLRWFARELQFDLRSEGYEIDMDYLNLQRRPELLKLAEIGELEHARGSVTELKERILHSPGSVDRIGVPADLARLYGKPYPEPEGEAFDSDVEHPDDFADDIDDGQLAAALRGERFVRIVAGPGPEGDHARYAVVSCCIECGCTDNDACNPPCEWLERDGSLGVCSSPACKKKGLKRWKKGDRELSSAARDVVTMRSEMDVTDP